MNKITSPAPFSTRGPDFLYREFGARDESSDEMPETLCDVVNRICDRYLVAQRDDCAA